MWNRKTIGKLWKPLEPIGKWWLNGEQNGDLNGNSESKLDASWLRCQFVVQSDGLPMVCYRVGLPMNWLNCNLHWKRKRWCGHNVRDVEVNKETQERPVGLIVPRLSRGQVMQREMQPAWFAVATVNYGMVCTRTWIKANKAMAGIHLHREWPLACRGVSRCFTWGQRVERTAETISHLGYIWVPAFQLPHGAIPPQA